MGTLATLAVILTLSAEAYHKGLEAAESKAESSSHNIGNSLASIGKGIAVAGIAAVTGGVIEMGKFLGESVTKAEEAQAAQSQLAAVLKSTNGASGMTADSINALAQSFAKSTMFAADQTVAGENMLLTFTNIGKDVFPMATGAMLNLSQAMGQDLKSSAIQLGKALNDPEKGMTALQRVGVTFTEKQKEVVKQLMATGKTAEAQKVILAELTKEFGGSAEAAGNTAAGKMAIFNHAMEEIQETIGAAILPILAQLASVMADVLESPGIQAGIQALVAGLQDVGTFVSSVVGYFQQIGANDPSDILAALANGFLSLGDKYPIMQQIGQALMQVVNIISQNWPQIQATASEVWNSISTTISTVVGVIGPIVSGLVNSILAWWKQNGTEVMANVSAVWASLKDVFGSALTFIFTLVSFILTNIQVFWSAHGAQVMAIVGAMWTVIQVIFQTVTGVISQIFQAFTDLLQGNMQGFSDHLLTAWNILWSTIKLAATTAWAGLSTWFSGVITSILGFFNNTDWGQVGSNIINGIWNGLRGGWGWLTGQIGNLAASLFDAAKKALGIQSPSTAFAFIGQMMMSGMAQGINTNAGLPVSAVTNVAQASTQAAQSNTYITVNPHYYRGDEPMLMQELSMIGAFARAQ